MKMARALVLLLITLVAGWAQQSASPAVEVTGDVPHPRSYSDQEWKQLKHSTVTASNSHDNKTATFSSVWLSDLLKEAGLPAGDNLKGKALSTCVFVTARDGYQVAFSIAELDEGMGKVQVLIADAEDDKPLAQTAGPLRLVVPGEKRPARWVRMVKTIRVVANR